MLDKLFYPVNVFKLVLGRNQDHIDEPPDAKAAAGDELQYPKADVAHDEAVNSQSPKEKGHQKG